MSGIAAISMLTSASLAASPAADAVGPYPPCTATPPSPANGAPQCPPKERVETVLARGIGYAIYEPGPLTLSPIRGLSEASDGICDAALKVAWSGLEEKIQAIRASNPGKVVTVQDRGHAGYPRGFTVHDGNPRVGGFDSGTWASLGKPKWYDECSWEVSATVIISDPPSAAPSPAPTSTSAPAAPPARTSPAPPPPPPTPTMPPPSPIPADAAVGPSPSLTPTMEPPAPIPADTPAAPTTTMPADTPAAPTTTMPPTS